MRAWIMPPLAALAMMPVHVVAAAVVLGTWANAQFPTMIALSRERHPFVKIKHNRTSTAGRAMQIERIGDMENPVVQG